MLKKMPSKRRPEFVSESGEATMKVKKTIVTLIVLFVMLIGVLIFRFVTVPDHMAVYTHSPYGFEMKYPKQMKIDRALAAVRTRFFDENTQIDVYYDNFNDTVSNAETYIGYGNRFIENTKDHRVTKNETKTISGLSVHLLKWDRDKLKHVENDKPYYASAEIVKNDKEVYTILIKSSQPIDNDMDIVESFRLIQPKGMLEIGKVTRKEALKTNKETTEAYRQLFMGDKLKWGIFEPTAPAAMDKLHSLEQKLDYKFSLLTLYKSLSTGFPADAMQNAQDDKRIVELTLQTLQYGEDNRSVMYDILNGKYDDYFTKYAQDIKAFGHPLLFRLNNEMNGDWVPYSAYHNSKDPEIYTAVWRYLHDIFEKNSVDNVLWIWNPNNLSKPGFQWNHPLLYYPGDAYVDVVGLTAYNTGTFYEGEEWSTFNELYAPLYAQYSEWFDQPLMITEFASSSVGGDKADWVKRMFEEMGKYPNIKAAIWWSHTDFDQNNEPARKYKLDETPELIDIFKKYLQGYK